MPAYQKQRHQPTHPQPPRAPIKGGNHIQLPLSHVSKDVNPRVIPLTETETTDTKRIFVAAQAEATSFPLALSASDVTHTPSFIAQPNALGTMHSQSWRNGKNAGYIPSQDNPFVWTGNGNQDAPTLPTTSNMPVQAADTPHTGPTLALAHRKVKAKTPYMADAWDQELSHAGLSKKFSRIPNGLRTGFSFNYPIIHHSPHTISPQQNLHPSLLRSLPSQYQNGN